MTARSLIAASLLVAAGSAFAADAPATAGANAAATAGATAAATAATATAASNTASKLNLPVLKSAGMRTRAEVRAEAIEAVKHHQTTLALQLDLAK